MLLVKVNRDGGQHENEKLISVYNTIYIKMKSIIAITVLTATVALAAPVSNNVVVDYPINKDESERIVCGSWMLKTRENSELKIDSTFIDSTFKPNVEYSTSSLIGENGKFTITNTDEVFYMDDFYNMMNYGSDSEHKSIIWSINGSIKFYNCIKQSDINPNLVKNETYISLDEKDSVNVRGCMNNVDCINIHCTDKVYVKDTLSCYPNKPGKVLGNYISQNNDW